MPKRVLNDKINRRAAKAVGPVWTGQVVPIDVEDDAGNAYRVQWLPDKNNDLLREAGKPMHFYYLPDKPRLTTDEDGHFQFHLQKFSGVMDPTKNIGEDGFSELTGGCLTFTSTLGMPKDVLNKSFAALKEQLPEKQSQPLFFWRQRSSTPPVLAGPVALNSNRTVLHALRPEAAAGDEQPVGDGAPAPNGNPDAWAFEIQGAGDGTVNVLGSNAFTVMLGNRPVQMLMASAESGTSQVTLENHIGYEIWTLVTEIKITGEWEHIYDHFSAHVKGGWWFTSAEFKHEVNNMIQDQVITVEVNFGAGMVDAAQQATYEKSADAIADQFMQQIAQKLTAAEGRSTTTAAEASPGSGEVKFFGNVWRSASFGAAFNNRKDSFVGSISYTKKINKQIVRSDMLSSQMEGLFDELQSEEEAKDRYFSEVFFEEGFKKIHVVASANAHWPSAEDGSGDPIHRMKLQVGYPDSRGNLTWKSAARFKESAADPDFSEAATLAGWTPDTKDRLYVFDFTRHDDLEDADQIHLKKTVSLLESPKVATNEVAEEEITNEHVVEVRAESGGRLRVGPIGIDMPLGEEDAQVTVLVHVRTPTFEEEVFEFSGGGAGDATEKFYTVWYTRPEDVEPYEYKVEVVVKGRRFGQRALRWEGDWTQDTGSGALIAAIPEIPADLEPKIDEYLGLGQPA
jgi:hypothetical protein